MKIKEIPLEERPREKALKYGISTISDAELLAIIIGSGVKNKSALEIANSLLLSYQNIKFLSRSKTQNLQKEFGISQISALKLEATFEFNRRLLLHNNKTLLKVYNTLDLYHCYKYLEYEDKEIFLLIMFDAKNQIIKQNILYKGTDSEIAISLREVVVELLQTSSKKYALIHNHPNGEIMPSKEDIKATKSIIGACDSLGLEFFDHLIIFDGGFYSFVEGKAHENIT